MPIYEYECGNCGHRLEAMQKISDKPLTHCPQCEAEQLRKLISAAAFHLKGSGWYATDFKDKPKTEDKAGKAAEQGEAKTAAAKKESGAGTGAAAEGKKSATSKSTSTTE